MNDFLFRNLTGALGVLAFAGCAAPADLAPDLDHTDQELRQAIDAQLDTTFYGEGRMRAYHAQPITNEALTVTTDGKIWVGGHYQSTLAGNPMEATVGRIDVNGGYDSWGIGQKIVGKNDYIVTSLAPAGTTVVVGMYTYNGGQGIVSKLLNNSASIDTSFGTNGEFRVSIPGKTVTKVEALAAAPQGKFMVAGSAWTVSNGKATGFVSYVLRLNSNGSRDTSFAIATIAGEPLGIVAHRLSLPKGKSDVFMALERSIGTPFIAHITSAGALDTNFSGDGVRTFQGGVYDIAAVADGSVYAVVSGGDDVTLVHVDKTGKNIPGFSGDGIASIDYPGFSTFQNPRLHYSEDFGRLFVAGDSFKDTKGGDIFLFAAIRADGKPDWSFHDDGFWTTDFYTLADNQQLQDLAIVGDKLLAMGNGTDATGHGALLSRYRIDHGGSAQPCNANGTCNSSSLTCTTKGPSGGTFKACLPPPPPPPHVPGTGDKCMVDPDCGDGTLMCRAGVCDTRGDRDPCSPSLACGAGLGCVKLFDDLVCWASHPGGCNDPGESCCSTQTSPPEYGCTGNYDDGTEPGELAMVCNNFANSGLPGSCVATQIPDF